MAETIRVGVMGLTHDHVWENLAELGATKLGRLVAAADPNAELLEKVRQETGCSQTFDSYADMLDEVELDAVYIYADNATGADLAVMAANAGLHVMVEKPMASTLEGAVAMLAAARSAGRLLMVNWPFTWWPGLQKAFAMVQAGEIGQVFSVVPLGAAPGLGCTPSMSGCMTGTERGRALMDYCCYGGAGPLSIGHAQPGDGHGRPCSGLCDGGRQRRRS